LNEGGRKKAKKLKGDRIGATKIEIRKNFPNCKRGEGCGLKKFGTGKKS